MDEEKKKDNSDKIKEIAIDILEGIVSGVTSGLIVYWITK